MLNRAEQNWPTQGITEAYRDGYKSGQIDRRMNWRSDYAWYGVQCDAPNTYSHEYSRGYRAAFREVK